MLIQPRKISPTKDTPEITLNPSGYIKIVGRSVKVDSIESSPALKEWIDSYISDPADITNIDISLEYINTINVKSYISLLKKIESSKHEEKKCVINWYYEEGDDDILEKGEYISTFLTSTVNFIEKSDPASGGLI